MRKIDYLFLVLVLVVGLSAGVVARKINDDRIHADIVSNQPQIETFVGTIMASGDIYQLVTVNNVRYDIITTDPSLEFGAFLNQKVKILGQKQTDTQIVVTSVTTL